MFCFNSLPNEYFDSIKGRLNYTKGPLGSLVVKHSLLTLLQECLNHCSVITDLCTIFNHPICASFQVLSAPESWSKHFFQSFSTFFLHFKYLDQLSSVRSTRNLVKIHNTRVKLNSKFIVGLKSKNLNLILLVRATKLLKVGKHCSKINVDFLLKL